MLSRSSKWISFSLIATAIGVSGCRSQMPAGNIFKITQHDSVDLPEVESPRQRLASTNPRAGSDLSRSNVASSNDQQTNPHRAAATHRQTDPSNPKSTASSRPRSTASAYSRAKPESKSSPDETHAVAKRTPSESSPASRPQPDDKSKLSDDELMEAFANTTPEVKEQALRQLVAVLSRNADSTAQPSGLDKAIRESLKTEHDLLAVKNKKASEPVNRLASHSAASSESDHDSPDKSAVVITYENETKPEPKSETAVAQSASDSSSSTPGGLEEAVVQSISDVANAPATDESGSVKPVSATASKQDPPQVTTAAMQSPATAPTTATVAAPNVDEISDQLLYETLLKRVASATPGESEAEKARRVITARHLMVLAGNPDKAVEKIEGMTDKEQEYLRHQLLGLWTMVDPDGHPVQSRRFSSALPQLREATKYLAAATDSLEVRSLAFCTEILAYGQIKPFSSNRFQSGQQVILYCEVENFIARKIDSGFQTHLQGSYDILDADNQKVASQLLPADQQTSSNYLRDYFIAYQMHLPKQLPAGNYRLQLTMEDVQGKKYGQASIPFEISQ
ncbi:putative secreted protein [Rhodopirellula maiorica SM1]|uniref:Putative secreted protein n=1 Tax=Rhodopirellula maiorica SM1 TaxID=1265738 RepID=M5RU93_9BACT|nr:hypothetical protein [Rhodopirellula maiorica]EMI22908.1 putative secreted protein [Rhodopirellula maiorica SM1]